MKNLISQAVVSSHVTMNSCLIIAFMKQASKSEDAWGLLQVQPVTGESVLISPNHFRLDQGSFSIRDILMDVFKKLPQVVCLLFGILVLFAWTNLKTYSFK